MDVKRIAAAGVVVEGRRELYVNILWKGDSRSHLPREQECIGVRDQLIASDPAGLPCGGRARPDRVFRIGVVVNKLCEVGEDVDLQLERFGWRRCDESFSAFLAVTLAGRDRVHGAEL